MKCEKAIAVPESLRQRPLYVVPEELRVEPTEAQQNGIMYQIRQKYGSVFDTDSYKLSHHCQYIDGATRMMSYIESRGGEYDEVLNFGLQLIIKEYFLQRLTHEQVDNIIKWEETHFSGNITPDLEIALRAVIDEFDGRMPVVIRNAKEGLMIPVKNVLVTIESSVPDKRLFSLVSYFETKLLRVWNGMTLGTKSMELRKKILAKLIITSDIPQILIDIMMHDFGSRACTAGEQAAFGGAGHLVAFRGSDTTAAIMAIEFGYKEFMAGGSIPATEHSSTTSNGDGITIDSECRLVAKMFDNYAQPGAIFATVIDSFDALRFIREIAPLFKQRLKDSGAMKWVFRPDSGDPIKMPIKCVEELDLIFGHTVNDKGFKVLNGVGVIQGDGIGPDDVDAIMDELIKLEWCVSNIAFGMGGGLHQKHNRDTLKFSMKCCAIEVDGVWHDVYKDPAVYDADWNKLEESSFKLSKKGLLDLMYNEHTNAYKTKTSDNADEFDENWVSALEVVYAEGYLIRDMTMTEVWENAGTLSVAA